jgi:hypothetical protein
MSDGRKPALGYHDHYVVDGGKARIILGVLVTPNGMVSASSASVASPRSTCSACSLPLARI